LSSKSVARISGGQRWAEVVEVFAELEVKFNSKLQPAWQVWEGMLTMVDPVDLAFALFISENES
jgi:hypothetical protein